MSQPITCHKWKGGSDLEHPHLSPMGVQHPAVLQQRFEVLLFLRHVKQQDFGTSARNVFDFEEIVIQKDEGIQGQAQFGG